LTGRRRRRRRGGRRGAGEGCRKLALGKKWNGTHANIIEAAALQLVMAILDVFWYFRGIFAALHCVITFGSELCAGTTLCGKAIFGSSRNGRNAADIIHSRRHPVQPAASKLPDTTHPAADVRLFMPK
jgi:hypothetical protein